jgi:hypothetical protein
VQEQATLEKRRSDVAAERLLAGALRGRGGALTRADAVALTGLPADQTEQALKSLLTTYRSHLAVTDEGELIYRFDPAMVRRDRVPLGERLAAVGQALWRAFTVAFKVWIVFTLVFYVLAFVAMLVALVFARSASDRDDRRRGGDGFGFPWILWWMMPDWAPPEVRRRMPAKRGKRFYRSVFDFVFGPPRPPRDLLADEKQVVAYLRTAGGRITATDLVALTGWSYGRAEEEATRLLAAYDGEPEVAEDGTLIYSFPELRKTAGEEPPGPWLYTWQEQRALQPLTGNSEGTNVVIGLMNGFNLFAALAIGPAFMARYGIQFPGADLLVSWFPLAFSSVFFAVPGGRMLRRRREARRLARGSARALLIAEIVRQKGAAQTPEAWLAQAAERGPGLDREVARAELERLLVDLDGDVATDEAGQTRYAFPRVGEELAAAKAARALAPAAEVTPGTVVFASDDEQPKQPKLLN